MRTAVCISIALLASVPSAAASEIAYTRSDTQGSGIATIDPDSGKRKVLTSRAGYFDTEPSVSPDGRRIAFSRSTDGRRSMQIHVMRSDGSGIRRITSGRFDDRPAWSPTGNWIAYQAESGIRLVRPDGSDNHAVPGTGPSGGVAAYRPAWSPDGKWLSFSVGSGLSPKIMIQRPNGSAKRRLAAGWSSDWSPDGKTIAMTGPDGGVFRIAASGGRPRMLYKGFEPVWSPSGTRIAYTRWPDDNRMEVWVMRPDGSGRRRIVRDAESPSWRP